MKIIQKPKYQVLPCTYCGTVVKLKEKDIKKDSFSLRRENWICPFCGQPNVVKFIKEKQE